MQNTKHTPGKWTFSQSDLSHDYIIWDTQMENDLPKRIARVLLDDVTDKSQQEANARLIASAPELMEALEMALEWIDALPKDIQLPVMPGFDRDAVNNLIAKAKGGQL